MLETPSMKDMASAVAQRIGADRASALMYASLGALASV